MDIPTIPEKQKDFFFPPLMLVFLLLLAIMLGALLGGGILYALAAIKGVALGDMLQNLQQDSSLGERNFVRTITFINHLFTFLLPALLLAFFIFKKRWLSFLKLDRLPFIFNLVLSGLVTLAFFPIAQFLLQLNQKIPLPDWATTMEKSTQGLVNGLLVMNSPFELLFNLTIIAILPALGEELIFRGVLQQSFTAHFKKNHLAIWLAAFLFSAIHLQFEGFLPRLILGAALGYLFYWTKNLWIPIFAHFSYNAIQILAAFAFQDKLFEANLENAPSVSWRITLISIIFVSIIGYILRRFNTKLAS